MRRRRRSLLTFYILQKLLRIKVFAHYDANDSFLKSNRVKCHNLVLIHLLSSIPIIYSSFTNAFFFEYCSFYSKYIFIVKFLVTI